MTFAMLLLLTEEISLKFRCIKWSVGTISPCGERRHQPRPKAVDCMPWFGDCAGPVEQPALRRVLRSLRDIAVVVTGTEEYPLLGRLEQSVSERVSSGLTHR